MPPVQRGTSTPGVTRVTAPPAPFASPVTYPDGVKLAITGITQGTSQGKGPGVFVGSPRTAVALDLTNGTTADIGLDHVVVTMTYATPRLVASPVYEDGTLDLTGTVKPGEKATATYMFSVPTDQLDNVTMSVDFDGVHAAATFEGSVK